MEYDDSGMEKVSSCHCCEDKSHLPEFHKIVHLKRVGLKVYLYVPPEHDISNASNKDGVMDKSFIIQNTKNEVLQVSDVISDMENVKLNCERCDKMLEYSKKLLRSLPFMKKIDLTGICDQCRFVNKEKDFCKCCQKTVERFITITSEKEDVKILEKPKGSAKKKSYSDFEIITKSKSFNETSHVPEIKQMFRRPQISIDEDSKGKASISNDSFYVKKFSNKEDYLIVDKKQKILQSHFSSDFKDTPTDLYPPLFTSKQRHFSSPDLLNEKLMNKMPYLDLNQEHDMFIENAKHQDGVSSENVKKNMREVDKNERVKTPIGLHEALSKRIHARNVLNIDSSCGLPSFENITEALSRAPDSEQKSKKKKGKKIVRVAKSETSILDTKEIIKLSHSDSSTSIAAKFNALYQNKSYQKHERSGDLNKVKTKRNIYVKESGKDTSTIDKLGTTAKPTSLGHTKSFTSLQTILDDFNDVDLEFYFPKKRPKPIAKTVTSSELISDVYAKLQNIEKEKEAERLKKERDRQERKKNLSEKSNQVVKEVKHVSEKKTSIKTSDEVGESNKSDKTHERKIQSDDNLKDDLDQKKFKSSKNQAPDQSFKSDNVKSEEKLDTSGYEKRKPKDQKQIDLPSKPEPITKTKPVKKSIDDTETSRKTGETQEGKIIQTKLKEQPENPETSKKTGLTQDGKKIQSELKEQPENTEKSKKPGLTQDGKKIQSELKEQPENTEKSKKPGLTQDGKKIQTEMKEKDFVLDPDYKKKGQSPIISHKPSTTNKQNEQENSKKKSDVRQIPTRTELTAKFSQVKEKPSASLKDNRTSDKEPLIKENDIFKQLLSEKDKPKVQPVVKDEPKAKAEKKEITPPVLIELQLERNDSDSDGDDEFERTMNLKDLSDIIIGDKIIKKKTLRADKNTLKESIVPVMLKSNFTDTAAPKDKVAIVVNSETKLKARATPVGHLAEQELPKGITRYALSDRAYIEKGWTMLPTEKVVRKMNVYRMRPAHPEFDWFEHNKKKQSMTYDTGEKLAEFEESGRGRWFYRNGRLALDYYDAAELNAQQRFVVYSSGEPDERGRSHPITVLATFDYLGNGVVFDHRGLIRLKYNQTEGVVLDRSIGPVSHWKWHTLNDPPVLQQVMIDTRMAHKDPDILKLGGPNADKPRPDNEEMLAIEFDNFIKEKSKKLSQKFKPFQIKMKALKINENFSLRVLDQATVYLIYRDGTTNLKLNIGMLLDHQEIVDTDTAEVGEVSCNVERLPAKTDSLAALQKNIAHAQAMDRCRVDREQRIRPTVPVASADQLVSACSRGLRPPLRTVPSSVYSHASGDCLCKSRKPSSTNLYYNTRLI